jgi:hypothetical protein
MPQGGLDAGRDQNGSNVIVRRRGCALEAKSEGWGENGARVIGWMGA